MYIVYSDKQIRIQSLGFAKHRLMKWHLLCVMDIGPRTLQEDSLLAGKRVYQENFLIQSQKFESDWVMAAVCDGLGGHPGGDSASRFVCESLNQAAPSSLSIDVKSVDALLRRIQRRTEQQLAARSGTTAAGLLIHQHHAVAFNVGDSRVYELNADGAHCLSHDHSLVQRLIDEKMITPAQAFKHPHRNIISFGLGPVFSERWTQFAPFYRELEIKPDFWYLICSDGLSDLMPIEQIHQTLMPDPMQKGPDLLKSLQRFRLVDNTSFVLLHMDN